MSRGAPRGHIPSEPEARGVLAGFEWSSGVAPPAWRGRGLGGTDTARPSTLSPAGVNGSWSRAGAVAASCCVVIAARVPPSSSDTSAHENDRAMGGCSRLGWPSERPSPVSGVWWLLPSSASVVGAAPVLRSSWSLVPALATPADSLPSSLLSESPPDSRPSGHVAAAMLVAQGGDVLRWYRPHVARPTCCARSCGEGSSATSSGTPTWALAPCSGRITSVTSPCVRGGDAINDPGTRREPSIDTCACARRYAPGCSIFTTATSARCSGCAHGNYHVHGPVKAVHR